MNFKLVLNGLDCANCANKIEVRVNKINGIKEATMNFSTSTLTIEIKEGILKEDIIEEVKLIVKALEPNVQVQEKINDKKLNNNIKVCTNNCCSIEPNKHDKEAKESNDNKVKKDKFKLLKGIKNNLILIIGVVVYIIALLYKSN